MEYHFSARFARLEPPAGGDVLKLAAAPGMIPFAAGNPSPETFPLAEMRQAMESLFDRGAAPFFQYGVSEGYQPLREFLQARMAEKHQCRRDQDQLLITSGGQQAIDLLTRLMAEPGDQVVVEQPTFMGALNAFQTCGVQPLPVPMEADGMNLDQLEQVLQKNPKVKFIYTITTFQNPTGFSTSMEKRHALYRLARQYDLLILEDNPYFELRYDGEYLPPLKSLDEEGRVVFAGSLSKILSPGVRLGYAQADGQIVCRLARIKQASDVHSNLFLQAMAAEYFSRNDLDRHIWESCQVYRRKRDLMLEALEQNLPEGVQYSRPEGGLFIWLSLPGGVSGQQLARLALEQGVAVAPDVSFFVPGCQGAPGVRLNYSSPSEEQIQRGAEILGQCVRQLLQ